MTLDRDIFMQRSLRHLAGSLLDAIEQRDDERVRNRSCPFGTMIHDRPARCFRGREGE
ncbi:MAG: hypothetical protein R6X02_00305 [Enhygromyxa sp.]